MQMIEFENKYLKLSVGVNGKALSFADKQTGKEYCNGQRQDEFARINLFGRDYPASQIQSIGGGIRVSFGDSGVQVDIKVIKRDHYLIFEVGGLSNPQVEELLFANFYLNLRGTPDDGFAACALALNLKTNVPEMPGLNYRLRAIGYRKCGLVGAKAAVIGCSVKEMRPIIKEVVRATDGLSHSPCGGPWALDTVMSRVSSIFDSGDIGEHTADRWIELLHRLGFKQVCFHGGKSFRFGDFQVNPELYPRGWDGFKTVIDKFHAAGIAALLHTYSFCIDKKCAWVTPTPDSRLAKDVAFTLASSIDPGADSIPTIESTEYMSATAGECVPELGILQNSVALQIDDEIILYSEVNKQPPYGLLGCERGALGTRKAPHEKGVKVHHLKECFRHFVPDGESSLFAEVAERTAEFYNHCGFDSIYLDALDGETVFGGRKYGWYYGARFAHELFRRLKKPAFMEMATFHHHLWQLRSQVGAWDHPCRGYKRFVDYHVASNARDQRMFMPGYLGWWTIGVMPLMPWHKLKVITDTEMDFTDDIEYLCGKALATDVGIALMGIDPDNIRQNETIRRKAEIIRGYETLRQSGCISEDIKAKLRQPGVECVIRQEPSGNWQLKQAESIKSKATIKPGGSEVWIGNNYDSQSLQIRLEVLMSAGRYDAPDSMVLDDFNEIAGFSEKRNAPNVSAEFCGSLEQVKAGLGSACFSAMNKGANREGAWSKIGKIYAPAKNLSGHEALGAWIYGDGNGEILNFQLRNPEQVSGVCWDRYVKIDFTGWKYIELIEPDTDYYVNYQWPYFYNNSLMEIPSDHEELEVLVASSRHLYRAPYHIFSSRLDYEQVVEFNLWYNNLPPGKNVKCYISPVKALPLLKTKLHNPRVRIADKEIGFPVEMETGQYLEFYSMSDCKLYKSTGELICAVCPQGALPDLLPGENSIRIAGESSQPATSPRVQITVFSQGEFIVKDVAGTVSGV